MPQPELEVVHGLPDLCYCAFGSGCHLHPEHNEWCPVSRRWYCAPRYAQMDHGIAGVEWADLTGVRRAVLGVTEGIVEAGYEHYGIPTGVYLCLVAFVQQCRENPKRSDALPVMVAEN